MNNIVCKSEIKANSIVIKAFYNKKCFCEYYFDSERESNSIGNDLIKTTLLSWATIDLCNNNIELSDYLTEFEYQYIADNYNYCTKTYAKIYKIDIGEINCSNIYRLDRQNFTMTNEYLLGYTCGKDSTLCKLLLEKTNKKINYYKLSYDDSPHEKDGHVCCNIIDNNAYLSLSISGIKSYSNIISCHQADDIHVTFAAPYFKKLICYPSELIVGLPWDAIHNFKDGTPDLVPTETYTSLKIFEKLLWAYGFADFKIISPIAVFHTFTIYSLLYQTIGLKELEHLDSCWTTSNGNEQCGFCPKCQRLKFVFSKCFDYNYLPDIINLKISSSDFIFGSQFAMQAIERYENVNWTNSILIDSISKNLCGEFLEIINSNFYLEIVNVENLNFNYMPDYQTWTVLLDQIKDFLKIDYSILNDDKSNNFSVPYLPFENYYKWDRRYKIFNCYNSVNVYNDKLDVWEIFNFSRGDKILYTPDNAVFRKYLSKDKIVKALKVNYLIKDEK